MRDYLADFLQIPLPFAEMPRATTAETDETPLGTPFVPIPAPKTSVPGTAETDETPTRLAWTDLARLRWGGATEADPNLVVVAGPHGLVTLEYFGARDVPGVGRVHVWQDPDEAAPLDRI